MDTVYISVNHLILYSHRSTEKWVNSYSLLFILLVKEIYQDTFCTLFLYWISSLKTNGKPARNSKNQPEQFWPFPKYPGLQLQLKDPSVLL